MDDDDRSNVSALRGQSAYEQGKAKGRAKGDAAAAAMTGPQRVAGMVIMALMFLAVAGALVRLNVWIWTGR